MKIAERYKGPGDIPAVLPVFPLKGCLLLPRAGLPLNIFEPRYLQMIDESVASHRLIVVVQPSRRLQAANDDDEAAESPQSSDALLRTTGCVGRITAFQEMEDGRQIISLTGVSRCSIGVEIDNTKLYRQFQISTDPFAGDFMAGVGEDVVPREQLLSTLKRFLEARKLRADWSAISRAGSEVLVNSLSVMSPYGPEEKQALLEASSLKARAEMLIALAEMELASPSGSTPGSTLQ